ncbi:MAG: ribonuclease Y [Fusobacteriota bacterium]
MEVILISSIGIIISAVLAASAGGAVGYILRKRIVDAEIGKRDEIKREIKALKENASKIEEDAKREVEALKKEAKIQAKEEAYKLKEEAEKEIKEANNEIKKKEDRIIKKEESLDKKTERIEKKETELLKKTDSLTKKEEEIEQLKEKREKEIERIAELTKEEAQERLLSNLEKELTHERALLIKESEEILEEEKDKLSKKILSNAINKAASDYVVDTTIAVVHLPNDDMKGRIIGREGRNIRALEAQTGVDVIIDDTPEAVVLSSFDSVRREIARIAVEKLVEDGRIHPARIEEIVAKAKEEVDAEILDAGEQALLETNIHNVKLDVKKTLGRLRYRTSYGQNILNHSMEVANIMGMMASELGIDERLARRAGLFHDIGKALDHDKEGSHAVLGANYLKKFNEKDIIVNAVGAHHGDTEKNSIIAVLVEAADAVSASRPGARRETLETYIKRLKDLEKIGNDVNGVKQAYAIQAGREIRIIIDPEQITDDRAINISREVAKKIEEEMQYPGQIKVTVVRETRAVEYAK